MQFPSHQKGHETRTKLLSFILRHPGLSASELAQKLNCCEDTVTRQAKKLIDLGYAHSNTDGDRKVYYPGARVPAYA